jgi:hypothetical protein
MDTTACPALPDVPVLADPSFTDRAYQYILIFKMALVNACRASIIHEHFRWNHPAL